MTNASRAIGWQCSTYLVYAVIVIGTLDPANERGVMLFNVRVARVGEATLDAGTAMP
jgi:hypothetical protein